MKVKFKFMCIFSAFIAIMLYDLTSCKRNDLHTDFTYYAV